VIDDAEDLVHHPHFFAVHILRLAGAHQGILAKPIEPPDYRVGQRPLNVAEQDDPRHAGLVLGDVDEGLVEQDRFAVPPMIGHAVDDYSAARRIGRHEAQVIAQRSGVRIPMRAQFSARRQRREHRRIESGDRFDQATVRGQNARAESSGPLYHFT
jgi:hypothetical protein